MEDRNSNRWINRWLWLGLIMLFFQVVIGGITRLTESGLSITKWEIITGTLPPMNEIEWQTAYDLYKDTPQYKEVNEGISMKDFKYIYFWEYFHRLWARVMGFVFVIPFIYFTLKGYFKRNQIKQLLILVFLAALAAGFGWIMVASGLVERPWVNAYKLSIHLILAFSVIAYLWWLIVSWGGNRMSLTESSYVSLKGIQKLMYIFLSMLIFQIFLGGMMSGMKIAVLYPTWPSMYGNYVPDVLLRTENWNLVNMVQYDSNDFFPALIHFMHRNWAYLVFLLGNFIVLRFIQVVGKADVNIQSIRTAFTLLSVILLAQMILGIVTVITSVGKVSVLYGVLHQSGALVLFILTLYIIFAFHLDKTKIQNIGTQ